MTVELIATIDKNISSIDLTTMRKIRQEVLQWDIFKDLGALDSSSRFFEEGGSAYPPSSISTTISG
jgi:hypothetical protein